MPEEVRCPRAMLNKFYQMWVEQEGPIEEETAITYHYLGNEEPYPDVYFTEKVYEDIETAVREQDKKVRVKRSPLAYMSFYGNRIDPVHD